MNIYYTFINYHLYVYDNDLNLLFKTKCNIGDSILIVIEDYIKNNNINIYFEQLIPLFSK